MEIAALIVASLLGGGGVIGAIYNWYTFRKQSARQSIVDFLDTFERQAASAEKRGDADEATRIRKQYEGQLEALRAQQGLEKIAPKQISAGKEEPSLTEGEVQQLKQLLTQSQPLSPALLTADESFLRGNAYYEVGQYAEALTAYDHALQLRPDDALTLMNRGVALAKLNRHEEALAAHDRALQLRPDHALTLTNRGAALSRLNRHEEALPAYDRAIQLDPEDPGTFMNRGITLSHLDRREEALQAYTRSLQLRPDHAATLMNRGVTLHRLNRFADALDDYNRALQLRPDHANTLYNRACLFSVWNKPAEALEDLRRAIAGDPQNRQDARTDSDFDNIRDDPRFQELLGEDEPPVEGGSNS